MNYLFIVVYGLWFLSEVFINRALRSKSTDKQGADKGSLSLIWTALIVAVTLAIYIAFTFRLLIANTMWIEYVGIALILIGILLRIIALRTLGRYFTADVTIRQGHQLIKEGFYKYFRHPSYTASLLTFIGFGLSLNNWASLLIVVVTIIIVFRFRIKVEEDALTAQFGADYLKYKSEAWGLIPFLYQ